MTTDNKAPRPSATFPATVLKEIHRAADQAARFRNTQVKRLLDTCSEVAIGGHRHKHIRGFDADFEVREVEAIQVVDMAHGGFHQRCRCGFAIFLLQVREYALVVTMFYKALIIIFPASIRVIG